MRTEGIDSQTRLRQVRREISREHGNDPQRLVAHYIQLQDAAMSRKSALRTGRQVKSRRAAGSAKP